MKSVITCLGGIMMGLLALSTQSSYSQEAGLRYRLEAQESYIMGQPVNLRFTLENISRHTIWVLTWYTPLEGLKGEIFHITRDGQEILYEGRLVKRGDPSAADYVRLEPGKSVTAEVDLSRSYNLSIPGKYQVKFKGKIWDMVDQKTSVPRGRDHQRASEITGNTVTFRMVKP